MTYYTEILTTFIGIGVLIAGVAYGYSQWKRGKTDGELGTITLLEKRIGILEETIQAQDVAHKMEMESQGAKITSLTEMVEKLKATIEEKDAKLTEYMAIMQVRDPIMNEFMSMVKSYVGLSKPFIEEIKEDVVPVVKHLGRFLDKQQF